MRPSQEESKSKKYIKRVYLLPKEENGKNILIISSKISLVSNSNQNKTTIRVKIVTNQVTSLATI